MIKSIKEEIFFLFLNLIYLINPKHSLIDLIILLVKKILLFDH